MQGSGLFFFFFSCGIRHNACPLRADRPETEIWAELAGEGGRTEVSLTWSIPSEVVALAIWPSSLDLSEPVWPLGSWAEVLWKECNSDETDVKQQ